MKFSTITLSDIYAALAYYHDNRDAIRRQIEKLGFTVIPKRWVVERTY